jgi:hypothetical protein
MNESDSSKFSSTVESELSSRDWILLPLISLVTICLVTISGELVARQLFTESPPFVQSCLEPGASWFGSRAIPNSVCWDKKFESEWVEYQFNACGHRSRLECKTKQMGVYRIVLAGSSIAMGHLIPEDRTFATLLPISLEQQTGRKVELYNEGMVGANPHILSLHFDEVLAAKPDLILWTLTAWDIQNVLPPDDLQNATTKTGHLTRAWLRAKNTFASKTFPNAIDLLWKHFWEEGQKKFAESSIAALMQRFILENKSQYIRSSLIAGDATGYLETHPNAEWQRRLQQFDSDASDIEAQAEAAGVPFVAVLVPNRVQAAMVSTKWPVRYDPYALDRELKNIIVKHGGTYIDVFPDLSAVPNPEQHYFLIDGHPDAKGHVMISGFLTKELTSGVIPELRVASQPKATRRPGT